MILKPEHFAPEFRLALLCCRLDRGSSEQAGIVHLLAIIEVGAFLDLVIRRHRVAPLVHDCLSRLPAGAVPAELLGALAAEVRRNTIGSLLALRTLIQIERGFRDAGIDWLAFKGVTVAASYYGDLALRQVNDLDLYVPPASVDRARAVLAGLGFERDLASSHADLAERGPRHRQFVAAYVFEESLRSREAGVIDLHWQLTEDPEVFPLDRDRWATTRSSLAIAGVALPVMQHEDLLIYLCEHGGRHGWFRLKWLVDLPRVIASQPFDWDYVLARARATGCEPSLRLGLDLAERLLGSPLPDALRGPVDRGRFRGLLHGIVGRLLRRSDRGVEHQASASRIAMLLTMVARLLLAQRWSGVAHLIRHLSLSPYDVREFPLADAWFPLYRLLRPGLMVWRRARYWILGRAAKSAEA